MLCHRNTKIKIAKLNQYFFNKRFAVFILNDFSGAALCHQALLTVLNVLFSFDVLKLSSLKIINFGLARIYIDTLKNSSGVW